jgi:hypothetical protein
MSSPATSHSIKQRTIAKDVFYTPLTVVKNHLDLIKGKPNEIWYDPFYGKGIYHNNFPTENKVYTEITMNKDFFEFNDKVDLIVSNPPYSILDEVLKHSVELKPRIISYLLREGSVTPKRMEYMKSQGYGLVSLYTCKVYQWYGMSQIYTFEKDATWDSCKILFDRTVHR